MMTAHDNATKTAERVHDRIAFLADAIEATSRKNMQTVQMGLRDHARPKSAA